MSYRLIRSMSSLHSSACLALAMHALLQGCSTNLKIVCFISTDFTIFVSPSQQTFLALPHFYMQVTKKSYYFQNYETVYKRNNRNFTITLSIYRSILQYTNYGSSKSYRPTHQHILLQLSTFRNVRRKTGSGDTSRNRALPH